MDKGKLILDEETIRHKIKRIAFEIYEANIDESAILLIGIWDRGYEIAEKLQSEIREISPLKVDLIKFFIDKQQPDTSAIEITPELPDLSDRSVILVDDVLNTGKTLAYSIVPLLEKHVRKLETVVLVNRSHKLYPISATFTGLELATTLDEHIEVIFDGSPAVYLK